MDWLLQIKLGQVGLPQEAVLDIVGRELGEGRNCATCRQALAEGRGGICHVELCGGRG